MSLSVYCCKYVHDNPEDITKEEACLAANHVNEFATHVVGSPLTEAGEGATNLHVDHGVGDQDLSMAMHETSGSGSKYMLLTLKHGMELLEPLVDVPVIWCPLIF
ncbi:unnamed protein product [Lactuca virosa]|uniref:Uncharacterized protein n=1 Tax=Lactuca virosa TaxID=75947 RepID=A0AAU9MFX1_9ASTR|nr:unnamed protein product [Lactuca virosa]